MSHVVTPMQVEQRLKDLSKEVDRVQKDLEAAERNYFETKAKYEISLAKSRLAYAEISSPKGKNYTVQEREDLALIDNKEFHLEIAQAEAIVRAVRGDAQRVRMQVDLARSIGTSVRTSMES